MLPFQTIILGIFGRHFRLHHFPIGVVETKRCIDLGQGNMTDPTHYLFGSVAQLVESHNATDGNARARNPQAAIADTRRPLDQCSNVSYYGVARNVGDDLGMPVLKQRDRVAVEDE